MPIPLGIFATAGAGGAGGSAFELISTQVLTSSASSVTFSSIPQSFKHLQIRAVTNVPSAENFLTNLYIRFNGVTSNSYAHHTLLGDGSSVGPDVTTSAPFITIRNGTTGAANIFGAAIVEILDYASTSKNTTTRTLAGCHTISERLIGLNSGLFNSTNAVTSVTLTQITESYAAGSRFSLYGIRG